MERDSGSHREHKKHNTGNHTGHYQHSEVEAMSSGEQWAQPHKKARLVDADTQAQYMDRNVLQAPRYHPPQLSQLSDKVDSAVQYSPTEASFINQVANFGGPVFPNMNMMNNSFYGFTNTGGHFNAAGAGGFYGFPSHSLGNFGLGKNDMLQVNVSAPSSTQNNASVNTTESGGLNGSGEFGYFTSQATGVDVQTQSHPHTQTQSQSSSTNTASVGTDTHSVGTGTPGMGAGTQSMNSSTQSHDTSTSTNGLPGPSTASVSTGHSGGPRTTKPKTFHCSQCTNSYTRADHLTRHFKKKHLSQSPSSSGASPGAFKYYGSATLSLLNGGKERKPEGPKQFFCMQCNAGFTRKDHLTRHNKRQHPSEHTTNASCQTPATAEFGYGCGHRSSGEGSSQVPKPFHCPDCTSSFTRVDHLTRHLKTQKTHFQTAMQIEKEIGKLTSSSSNPEKPLKYHACPLCGKLFTRQDHMKRHMKIHARGEPVKCGECQMWFPEKGQLNQHMLEAHHIQVFECCYCSKSFYECEFLTKHLKEKHNVTDSSKQANSRLGIAEPRYRCGICTLQFNKETECQSHMLHHVVPTATASLAAAIPLATSHISQTNTAISAAQISAAQLSAAAQLAAVSQAQEMWSRFTFPPERTSSQFASNGLNVPQFTPQSHTSKENMYGVYGGDREKGEQLQHGTNTHAFSPASISSSSLVTSPGRCEMSVQAESGQYLCGVCGSSFTKASELKQHIKRHAGDRPHGCHDCGASFGSASNLQRHQRIHSGQRPFRCSMPQCDSAFTHKGALVNHERIHTGERPFVCDLCDASFTRKDALDRHKKTHKENRIKQEREMSTSTDDLDFPPLH